MLVFAVKVELSFSSLTLFSSFFAKPNLYPPISFFRRVSLNANETREERAWNENDRAVVHALSTGNYPTAQTRTDL